jgi:hypothetical protein
LAAERSTVTFVVAAPSADTVAVGSADALESTQSAATIPAKLFLIMVFTS